MIEIFSVARDNVIKSSVSAARADYSFALEKLYPLINKFDEQRKVQRKKFYERLRLDIVRGCIMPPITIAFVDREFANESDPEKIKNYIIDNIEAGYILDGMQRLNTLHDASDDFEFNKDAPLYINVIIAERYDLLLYRMVTLNNGQKPMTARHQIEMLTKGILDTEHLSINIVSEKDTESTKPQGSFRRSDVSAAYTAFLTNSVHNDNSRIIESKLDEILVGKVMDSNLTESDVTFQQVLELVDKFSASSTARDWLRLGNNLIGFSVGARKSYEDISKLTAEKFAESVEYFDKAFESIDVSKINVGKVRRDLAKLFIEEIGQIVHEDEEGLTERFFNATLIN